MQPCHLLKKNQDICFKPNPLSVRMSVRRHFNSLCKGLHWGENLTVMETCREEVIQTKARDAEGLTVLETRREELAIRGTGAAQGKQGCRTVGGWNQTELSCQGKEIRRYEVFLWLTTWYLYWYKVTLILQRTEGQRITFLLQWNYRWSLRVHILCWDER